MQTSSSIQNTKVHIIFTGKDNESTEENRHLQRLMEFMEIEDKGKLVKQIGKSKPGYKLIHPNQVSLNFLPPQRKHQKKMR